MHGSLVSSNISNTNVGGITIFSSYLKILREKYGENLLWLDAGD